MWGWFARRGDEATPLIWVTCIAVFVGVGVEALLIVLRDNEVLVDSALQLWTVAVVSALFAIVVGAASYGSSAATRGEREKERRWEESDTGRLSGREERWGSVPAGMEEKSEVEEWRSEGKLWVEDLRLAKRRPFRLYLTLPGIAVVVIALLLAAALPALQLRTLWLGVSLASASVICMLLWRVAIFTRDRVIWFGLAVFLSVPLFGTFMQMARNLDDPQIQPIALIRSTDRTDESIHGLYVTEAKDRVYFATVATEGCTGTLRENSGRLLWVPRKEVVAMSIGPLQSVQDAAKTSLEMAFALTPAVETPSGDSVSLNREEPPADGDVEAPLTVQRLENVGSAVRPTFGRGLELDPEEALPGDQVTLTMSTPIKNGFGRAREGRNLRVGGTPAKIPNHPNKDGSRAEFVKAADGRLVKLDKSLGVYVESEPGEFERLGDAPRNGPLFVRVAEDAGVEETDHVADDGRLYLELTESEDGVEAVAGGEHVRFKREGEQVLVEPQLWRQAWNKARIEFEVPEKSSTGTVTVDCEQLAGQPLLQVERPPEAQFSMRLADGGRALELDGHRSHDDSALKALRWAHDGGPLLSLAEKRGEKLVRRPEGTFDGDGRARVRVDNGGIHRVRLAVEDEGGEVDTASVYMLRVPSAAALSDEMRERGVERLREVLVKLAGIEAPVRVWVDSHGGAPGSALSEAKKAFAEILDADAAKSAELPAEGVPVTLRGFGRRCGLVPPGEDRQHLDVFIVVEGVRVLRPAGCRARAAAFHLKWKPKTDSTGPGR